MPLSATCQWEIRTTGNDNNGGAFRVGSSGVDYSQQDDIDSHLQVGIKGRRVPTTKSQI